MLRLAFDRKNRVLQVSVSGIFASADMDELDNALVEFVVSLHGTRDAQGTAVQIVAAVGSGGRGVRVAFLDPRGAPGTAGQTPAC